MTTTDRAVASAVERRGYLSSDAELRETTNDAGETRLTFQGHAAVFNVRSLPLWDPWYGEFREVVEPTFFAPVLDERRAEPLDVHLVYQHEMASTMADTLSGTLELRTDAVGLKVWAELDPEDPDVMRVRPKMKRIRQMSFGFVVERDRWTVEGDGENEVVTRYLVEARDVFDVSIVPQGAYPQTDGALRALQHAVDRGDLPQRLLDRAQQGITRGAKPTPDAPAGGDPDYLRAARARARVLRTVYPVTGGSER